MNARTSSRLETTLVPVTTAEVQEMEWPTAKMPRLHDVCRCRKRVEDCADKYVWRNAGLKDQILGKIISDA
jgi:hypothetical protein